MPKYNVGDMVIHDGGGYAGICTTGYITKVRKNAVGRLGYDVLVAYPDGAKDELYFFETEIIGKIN